MNRFEYVRAYSVEDAIEALRPPGTKVLAGGTNLVDLMKYGVTRPSRLVDINRLPLTAIEELPGGGLRLGALSTNADVAYAPPVAVHAPLVASAILSGASAQLRNAATTAGNLLQRTRCMYFYDTSTPCNKRDPDTGCSALHGINRMHAILGASDQCVAVHPSDMCVAFAALDARVNVVGAAGARAIAFRDFHRLPGDTPDVDTTLQPDEVVTSVELPPWRFAAHYTYLKVRDRLSYAFALVSVAVALEVRDGRVATARLALGGVAPKPWRSAGAEAVLAGEAPQRATFERAADVALEGATALSGNRFKIELARRTVVRALEQAAAAAPQSQSSKRVN